MPSRQIKNKKYFVQRLRNEALFYAASTVITPVMADLKKVYAAPNEEVARFALEELRKMGFKIPSNAESLG